MAFSRTVALIGEEKLNKLQNARVALFGVGGVGGFVLEGLVRSGVKEIDIFDSDVVNKSNLNRQIIANLDNLGKDKVQEAKKRAESISDGVKINCHKIFYLPENADQFNLSIYDYVIDAIDTVSAKLEIIKRAKKAGVRVISSMGTGGKLDATAVKITDVFKTENCPLARVMRRELKKLNILSLTCVYSTEKPKTEKKDGAEKFIPSMIFVPAVCGLTIANKVVLDLIGEEE